MIGSQISEALTPLVIKCRAKKDIYTAPAGGPVRILDTEDMPFERTSILDGKKLKLPRSVATLMKLVDGDGDGAGAATKLKALPTNNTSPHSSTVAESGAPPCFKMITSRDSRRTTATPSSKSRSTLGDFLS